MIRVLIKALSPVLRAGLESLIRPYASLHVIRDFADDASPSGDVVDDAQPDVVLAELESRDDEIASEALDDAAAGIPVVLLVRGPAAEWVSLLRQGIQAVLPDNATGAQIAAAIEAVAAGLTVVRSDELESFLPLQRTRELAQALPESLTPREIEVLRAMAEGLGNKEIAARLRISEHTVKFHVASIMGKLGAASRTEAVTIGIRYGLVLI